MASSKDRQRKLARARMERRLVRQAQKERRRRQIQAAVASGAAVVLIILGAVWALGGFKSTPKPKQTVAAGSCTWYLRDPSQEQNVYDTGHPPVNGEPRSGTEKMTITTNQGVIEAELNLAKAPCTAESFKYLAGRKFFDNTPCHRLTTSGIYVLQCGDPSGTGAGGPSYRFADENLPTPAPSASPQDSASPTASPKAATTNLYPKGTLAMANSGKDTNGSQFFIVYKDGSQLSADYTIFGKVTKGLDIVEKIAKAGAVDSSGAATADGSPKTPVTIKTLTVSAPIPASPAPTAPVTPTPTASVKP